MKTEEKLKELTKLRLNLIALITESPGTLFVINPQMGQPYIVDEWAEVEAIKNSPIGKDGYMEVQAMDYRIDIEKAKVVIAKIKHLQDSIYDAGAANTRSHQADIHQRRLDTLKLASDFGKKAE